MSEKTTLMKGARVVSKNTVSEILKILNRLAESMKNDNQSKENIIKVVNEEICSYECFLNIQEPYNDNKDKELEDFVFDKSLLKFDPQRLVAFIADIYNYEKEGFSGVAIKSDIVANITIKNNKTNKLWVKTIYEDADLLPKQ